MAATSEQSEPVAVSDGAGFVNQLVNQLVKKKLQIGELSEREEYFLDRYFLDRYFN